MLDRSLTLTDLTLFGIVSIMGSGGFNLIGKGVRNGGSMWPLAMFVSALLLMGAAYSYAGAYERFAKNTAESDIIRSIFGDYASMTGSSAIMLYSVFSIVVILVFCTQMIIPSSSWTSQVGMTVAMLGIMTALSLLGIELNKIMINGLSWLLVAVLAAIAIIGVVGVVGVVSVSASASTPAPAPTRTSFMESLWMFFFILVGFDALIKFSEEAKDKDDIPTSFFLANGISVLLTLAMGIAVAAWIPNLTAANESMAIEHLFAKVLGDWALEPTKWGMIAFLLTTTFIVFISISRYLYGLGDTIEWLAPMKEVNEAQAPWKAILTVFGVGSLVAILNNVSLLVKITDLGFAVIAAMVAASVSVADWRDGRLESAAINGATGAAFGSLIASTLFTK